MSTYLSIPEETFDETEFYQNEFCYSDEYNFWWKNEFTVFTDSFSDFCLRYFAEKNIKMKSAAFSFGSDEYDFEFETEHDLFLFRLRVGV